MEDFYDTNDKDIEGVLHYLRIFEPENANREYATEFLKYMKLSARRTGFTNPDELDKQLAAFKKSKLSEGGARMTDITTKAPQTEEWIEQLWSDEQKRADAAGMNIIEYQMQANDGLLKPVITKLLRHNKAHPDTCPSDCAFQVSIKKLEEQYSIK
jgi:hypothetical protein